MGRKAVEMGRYGASELMRNKTLWERIFGRGCAKRT